MLKRISNFFASQHFSSKEYWEKRYRAGGNSGSGSYGRLAEFKAEIINSFVSENNVSSVIEFGCGDGNQLALASYPFYIGLDVSPTAVRQCIRRFAGDKTKSFFLYQHDCFADTKKLFRCELALSLDVIFHLVETDIYETYLRHLFASSDHYVIVYSSNQDIPRFSEVSHERHRKFTEDIDRLTFGWELFKMIENKFKPTSTNPEEGSVADFYFFRKKDPSHADQ